MKIKKTCICFNGQMTSQTILIADILVGYSDAIQISTILVRGKLWKFRYRTSPIIWSPLRHHWKICYCRISARDFTLNKNEWIRKLKIFVILHFFNFYVVCNLQIPVRVKASNTFPWNRIAASILVFLKLDSCITTESLNVE